MAYDEALADRVRDAFDNRPYVVEKKMFGGLGWMVHGNMAVAALGGGDMMVRVAKEDGEAFVQEPGAELMVMRGRAMSGWIHLDEQVHESGPELQKWVERGLAYALTLPEK